MYLQQGRSNRTFQNTNVIALLSRIIKDDHSAPQLTLYNSGIGTFSTLKSRWSPSYWTKAIPNGLDQAFAWQVYHPLPLRSRSHPINRSLDRTVQGAYRWLADHHQPGDKIYLFGGYSRHTVKSVEALNLLAAGFSRGAYQIRSLAGMIERVCMYLILVLAS